MKSFSLVVVGCALLAGLTGKAGATQITYTESFTASGSFVTLTPLGDIDTITPFTRALVTFVAIADTANVRGVPIGLLVGNDSLAVTVAGIGTATVTARSLTAAGIVSNPSGSFPFVNFNEFGASGTIDSGATIDTYSSAFLTYDLTTAIGPITGFSVGFSILSYSYLRRGVRH